MLIFVLIYLTALFIAPQLWIEPFVGIRVDLYIYPIWLIAAVAAGRFPQLIRFTTQDMFFLAMIGWMFVGAFVNGFFENTGTVIADYLKWFLMYKLVTVTVEDFQGVKKLALMLMFFALVLTAEGIQQKLDPGGIGWAGQSLAWIDEEALVEGITGRTRWINIFDGPGVFCVVYTITLPFLMQYLGKPFSRLTRLTGLLLLIPLLIAIYFTGSRGGFLASVAAAGLFILARYRVSLKRVALVGVLGGVVLLAAPSYLTSTRDSSQSAQHRIDMWAEGIEMVQQNPVFGIGKGNFLRYTSRLIAHNSAVEVMGETGVVGFFFWVALIHLSLKNLYRCYRENENDYDRSYVVALGISVIGYLISSLFVTLEYETFYFLLAMCAAAGKNLQEPVTFGEKDLWIVGISMIALFAALKTVVMLYY